ncbi:MAG: hypothetical protein DI601_07050 [Azospirillum brasilense]|nr:MAG: hypothetical protein DI601_07050 [Azospirillum brasilense]
MFGAIFGIDRINPPFDGLTGAPARGAVGRMLARLAVWHRNAATRRVLRELPERELADIGLTPMDAAMEASRPFWDGSAGIVAERARRS